MFEATLSDDFWGDEDFTCNQCHVTFASRRGASEHAETKHKVRRLLVKDRAQVKVDVESGDVCELINNIDINMNSKGEYFEFVKKEKSEEIKTEDVKMEELLDVNTNENLGLHTEMYVRRVKDEVKKEVKEVKIEKGGLTEGSFGEKMDEDEPETKFVPARKKPKIVLKKAKPEIPDEEENNERTMSGFRTSGKDAQNFEIMDQVLDVPQGTASVMDVHAAVNPKVLLNIVSSFDHQDVTMTEHLR